MSNNPEDFSFWIDTLIGVPSKPHDACLNSITASGMLPPPNSSIPEGSTPIDETLSADHPMNDTNPCR